MSGDRACGEAAVHLTKRVSGEAVSMNGRKLNARLICGVEVTTRSHQTIVSSDAMCMQIMTSLTGVTEDRAILV